MSSAQSNQVLSAALPAVLRSRLVSSSPARFPSTVK